MTTTKETKLPLTACYWCERHAPNMIRCHAISTGGEGYEGSALRAIESCGPGCKQYCHYDARRMNPPPWRR